MPVESVNWNTTQRLFIEGENIDNTITGEMPDALKLDEETVRICRDRALTDS